MKRAGKIDYGAPAAQVQLDHARSLAALLGMGLLAGGGLAVGRRALTALSEGARPAEPVANRVYLKVPVPGQEAPRRRTLKAAAAVFSATRKAATGGPSALDRVFGGLGMVAPTSGADTRWLPMRYGFPGGVPDKGDVPGYVALAAPLAIGGLVAGDALASRMLQAKRKRDQGAEVDDARARFLASISGKSAGEKQAFGAGTILGGLTAAYLLAGLGAGRAAYNWTKANSKGKAVRDALRQRREELYSAAPPSIVALPADALPEPRRQRTAPQPKFASMANAAVTTLAELDRRKQHHLAMIRRMQGVDDGTPPAGAAEPPPPRPPSVLPGAPPTPPGRGS